MEFVFETGVESAQPTGSTFKKLALPTDPSKGVVGVLESWKFEEASGNSSGYLELTFDSDGAKLNKRFYDPTQGDKATAEKVKQLTDDLTAFAKAMGAEIPQTSVSTWKDFVETTFATVKIGEQARLKVVYKDKVVQIDFDKAQGIAEEDLKAKFSPFVIITKSNLYWWRKASDTYPFKINEQYDNVDYEVMVKEQVLPSGVEDLPFATSTPAVVEDDMF